MMNDKYKKKTLEWKTEEKTTSTGHSPPRDIQIIVILIALHCILFTIHNFEFILAQFALNFFVEHLNRIDDNTVL